jgi:hypothetical protein
MNRRLQPVHAQAQFAWQLAAVSGVVSVALHAKSDLPAALAGPGSCTYPPGRAAHRPPLLSLTKTPSGALAGLGQV